MVYYLYMGKLSKPEGITLKVQQLEEIKTSITSGFLTMGKILVEIRAGKEWKNYASHLKTFDEFLREIRLGKSTAYNCMRLYSLYGETSLTLDYSRLVKSLPFITDGNKDEWATKAKELDAHDFHEELREAKGIMNCPHDEQEDFTRCVVCGKFTRQ